MLVADPAITKMSVVKGAFARIAARTSEFINLSWALARP
jgi:hypothetical protein